METNEDTNHVRSKRVIEEDTTVGNLTITEGNQVVIYLLVNPRSGSREGSCYTDLPKDQYSVPLDTQGLAELNIINITNPEEMLEFK